MPGESYAFTAEIYLWSAEKASWHFLALPKGLGAEINAIHSADKRGWGSLPVEVTIGSSTWATSIFPDKKSETFILPVKAAVRKKENIGDGSEVDVKLKIKA